MRVARRVSGAGLRHACSASLLLPDSLHQPILSLAVFGPARRGRSARHATDQGGSAADIRLFGRWDLARRTVTQTLLWLPVSLWAIA